MKKAFVYIFLALGILACKRSVPVTEEVVFPSELPEGFGDFYQRFLTDSLFQMEHIIFPLQGIPSNADNSSISGKNFRWKMEEWIMHRPIDKASGFSVNLKPVTDTYVLEEIRHSSEAYGMERRYAYMDDGWYLIYYAGLNPLGQ